MTVAERSGTIEFCVHFPPPDGQSKAAVRVDTADNNPHASFVSWIGSRYIQDLPLRAVGCRAKVLRQFPRCRVLVMELSCGARFVRACVSPFASDAYSGGHNYYFALLCGYWHVFEKTPGQRAGCAAGPATAWRLGAGPLVGCARPACWRHSGSQRDDERDLAASTHPGWAPAPAHLRAKVCLRHCAGDQHRNLLLACHLEELAFGIVAAILRLGAKGLGERSSPFQCAGDLLNAP